MDIKKKMIIRFKKTIIVSIAFLSACSTFVLKDIKYKSLNNDWDISHIIPNIAYYELGFIARNKDLPFITVNISNFRSTFGELWMWWVPPIPLVSYSNNYDNCTNNFYIKFEINMDEEAKIFLEKNMIAFDTSKVFIVKNGKKHKINLTSLVTGTNVDPLYIEREKYWNEDFVMNVSNYLLNKISKHEDLIVSIGREFFSPLGCKALEDTILIIDGISLNAKMLKPIEIKLNYKKVSHYENIANN